MELEKLVKNIENIRDSPLNVTTGNDVYHFVNRLEQKYKNQRNEVLKHSAAEKILTCGGILYLAGTGNIEVISPTYQKQYITPLNKNIELLRAPPTGLNFVDPTLREVHKTVLPKEIPITYKVLFVDVFSDNELREIWKLGRADLNYEMIFAPKTTSGRQTAQPGLIRGRDTGSLSARMRKTLSD
jgi:hypothetical protein